MKIIAKHYDSDVFLTEIEVETEVGICKLTPYEYLSLNNSGVKPLAIKNSTKADGDGNSELDWSV